MNTREQDETARIARERFEQSVDALPAATANRLRLARRAALAAAPVRRPQPAWALSLGATAALVLGLAWWRQDAPPAGPVAVQARATAAGPATTAVPSIAQVSTDDDADLYAWLADTPVASDADGGAL